MTNNLSYVSDYYIMGFFSRMYEQRLENIVRRSDRSFPGHIALIITESDLFEHGSTHRIIDFIRWSQDYHVKIVTIFVSLIDFDPGITDTLYNKLKTQMINTLKDINASIDLYSINGERINVKFCSTSDLHINISLGYSGKKELTRAFKDIMFKIESGKLKPEDIDETVIEKHLLIKYEPDLVIRSGGKRLADFLIWQSVYSEIYFTDVSWINLRKLDFLRAIRDYQQRQRRFGK
ncbi:MAG: undecaprenyl diphosphate synthase family protein [Euryarchaeota archaeon]|nr:undecaprenyl diphosphate synthase family protein [Euryarchaeota archaeon]